MINVCKCIGMGLNGDELNKKQNKTVCNICIDL